LRPAITGDLSDHYVVKNFHKVHEGKNGGGGVINAGK
jgi:hypothetical protein